MPDEIDGSGDGNDKYIVVARRYRPLQFDQLVGQETVSQALVNAIETNRVGHAYLFTGARGVGKTSTARIFAKALNAPEGPTASPDNSSDICQAIDAGEDVDVLEIDGASNRGIDEIRQLRAGVGMRPSRARFKIYIIDEVHMLTQQAFNALLKTLEEPPEHVKFIFCTTDPEKIPITVLSRCQRFDFAPVETDSIQARLQEIVESEKAEADPEALRLLARRAAGSMRDSQSLLEQVLSFATGKITVDQVHSMLGTADDARLAAMAENLIGRDSAAVLKMVDDAVMAGIDAGQFAEQLLGYFRDLMTATVGCGVEMLRHAAPSSYDDLAAKGSQLGIQNVLAVVSIIDQSISRMRQSVHSRVLLEASLVQICQLADLQAIANVAASVGGATGNATTTQKKKPEITKPTAKSQTSSAEPSASANPPADQATSDTIRPAKSTNPSNETPSHGQGASSTKPLDTGAPSAPIATPASSASVPQKSMPQTPTAENEASETKEPAATKPPAATKVAGESTSRNETPDASGASHNPKPSPNRSTQLRWDSAHVRQVWENAISTLDGMTANHARNAQRVEPAGEGCIRVVFSGDRQLDKTSCEKPERRSKLEAALAASANRKVKYECVLTKVAPTAAPPRRAITSSERAKRMREVEQEPVIKEMMELFEGEVIRVDPPQQQQ